MFTDIAFRHRGLRDPDSGQVTCASPVTCTALLSHAAPEPPSLCPLKNQNRRLGPVRASFAELMIQLGIGLIGGALAVMTWGLALRGVGADAALYRPAGVSLWPLLTALLAALATFGWRVTDEH